MQLKQRYHNHSTIKMRLKMSLNNAVTTTIDKLKKRNDELYEIINDLQNQIITAQADAKTALKNSQSDIMIVNRLNSRVDDLHNKHSKNSFNIQSLTDDINSLTRSIDIINRSDDTDDDQ